MDKKNTLPSVRTITNIEGTKVPVVVIESAANIIAYAELREDGRIDPISLALELNDGLCFTTMLSHPQPENGFRITVSGQDGSVVIEWKDGRTVTVDDSRAQPAEPYGDCPIFMVGHPVELD